MDIKMGIRGFEPVSSKFMKDTHQYYLPQRATRKSAGYDFKIQNSFSIKPGDCHKIYTNIKAYMLDDEFLEIHLRSSVAVKKHLRIKNIVGIIDADYYSNRSNDGNIIICLLNEGHRTIFINYGDTIAQGIFKKYLLVDDDNPESEKREGGLGSTDK